MDFGTTFDGGGGGGGNEPGAICGTDLVSFGGAYGADWLLGRTGNLFAAVRGSRLVMVVMETAGFTTGMRALFDVKALGGSAVGEAGESMTGEAGDSNTGEAGESIVGEAGDSTIVRTGESLMR